jgi:Dihydrodipicolinate synthase/N-acetylneuraminate lyase
MSGGSFDEEVSRHLYRPDHALHADGKKVDEAALRRLVDFQIEEGIHGLIPLGSTGEFLSVTPDERRQIVETWSSRRPAGCRC